MILNSVDNSGDMGQLDKFMKSVDKEGCLEVCT